MKPATMIRKLRADPDVLEAGMVGDRVKVRLRKGAGSEVHDRVYQILYGRLPTVREMNEIPPVRTSHRADPPPRKRGRAA